METKTYIVVLKEGVDYDTFWHEIESVTNGLSCVPDRPVGIVNNRSMFKKICEYSLTETEAENLKNDPRVAAVEIPVRDLPYVQVTPDIVQNASQIGPAPGMNFNKQPGVFGLTSSLYNLPYGASINWGLIRHINRANPYGINTTGANTPGLNTSQNYAYALDGTGVDVIINDSGIQTNHPEFTNSLGVSRVVRVDWNNIAGQLGIPAFFGPGISWNNLSYSDTGNDINGHGTHVAGIAVGKTYGWAKNANIISLIISNTGQRAEDPLDTFEMMIRWHQTKGNRNPTIVNMSWSIRWNPPSGNYYSGITGGSYRGNPILTGQSANYYQQRGLIPMTGNGFPAQTTAGLPGYPYHSEAYNTALAELINTGIIVVRSAGNNSFKIDKPNDAGGSGDYNNFITSNQISGTLYYHRGASPQDSRAIVVGALDTLTSNSAQDQKVPFSCAGPRVDVYAAGTYIMSAAPNGIPLRPGDDPGGAYYPNQKFKELVGSGTSQATPQIAGMAALYLQAHKPANIYSANNCSNVQSWITTNSTTNTFFQTGNATSYMNYVSLLGGAPRVAYQPLQGITYAQNNGWKQVANVYVKGESSWQAVKSAWTKTTAGWIQIF